MIYFFVLFTILGLCYLFEHAKISKKSKWIYWFVPSAIIILAFFSMQRGASGTDNLRFYEPYYYKYIVGGMKYSGKEYGYYLLCKLLYKINPTYKFELFGISSVIWSAFFFGTLKYDSKTKKSVLFLTLFLFCFYLAPSFNIMRQTLAASVVYVSYFYLIQRKPIKYIICILIATMFHTTAIVLLPMYFVISNENRKGYTLKNTLINVAIFLSPFIFIYSFDFLINLSIFEKYKTIYGETISLDIRPTRLIARIPLYILEIYLFVKTKRKMTVREIFWGEIVILEAMSIVLGFYSTWAYRLMYYFSFGHPLFVMESTTVLHGKNRKTIFFICGLYFIVYFTVFHGILKYDQIFPYNP